MYTVDSERKSKFVRYVEHNCEVQLDTERKRSANQRHLVAGIRLGTIKTIDWRQFQVVSKNRSRCQSII